MNLYARTLCLICIDIVGIIISHGFIQFILKANKSILFIVVSIALILLSNILSGSYRQLWRYTSFREVQNLFLSNLVAFSCLLILSSLKLISSSALILFNFFSMYFLFSIGVRALRRFYVSFKEKTNKINNSKLNVLIIGGGNSASTLIKHILTDKKNINICGILDNDYRKIGTQIHGISICNTIENLEHEIDDLHIQQAIIAMPSASKQHIKKIANRLVSKNIPFKIVPHIRDMIDSSQPLNLNTIKIDNLIDDREFMSFKSTYKNKLNRILITGGSGYIGVHLTNKLLANGYEVVLLDNHLYGHHGITHLKDHKNLRIVNGDIANIKDVVKSLDNVDTIIALAAIVGDPACGINPQETLNLNYESSKVLIETANFYGVQRLVFASSCSVYGVGGNDFLSETSPLNPVSLYAKTRIMSENIIFERSESVSPVILRLSTVFGYSPRMRFDLVVNLLTVKALVEKKFEIFGGDQWRPFIHCKDVANAFYLAATSNQSIVDRQIYNVGSDTLNHQLKEIGTMITKNIPSANFDIINDNIDERNYRVNFEKIKSQLNFIPEYNLDLGIQEMITKIQNSNNLQNYKNTIYSNVETLKSQQ